MIMLIHHEHHAERCPNYRANVAGPYPEHPIADADAWAIFCAPGHDWRPLDLGPDEPASWHCLWCGRMWTANRRGNLRPPEDEICYDRRDNQESPPCGWCASEEDRPVLPSGYRRHQLRISVRDQLFLANLEYLRLMVDAGMVDESELPNLCGSCGDLGIARPAIFGEDFCADCWDGRWQPAPPERPEFPVYVGWDGQEHGEF